MLLNPIGLLMGSVIGANCVAFAYAIYRELIGPAIIAGYTIIIMCLIVGIYSISL